MSEAWRPFVPDRVLDLVRDSAELPLARPVTGTAVVLFADIAGFTRLSEVLCAAGRQGAEELSRLLNRYFGSVIEVIVRYGGEVMRFAGDAVTAVFPYHDLDGADVARRAVRCALDMQAATTEFTDVSTTAGPVRLAMKAGLARGTLSGAVFGDPAIRVEYVVSGDPLALAATAEHHASPGEVLLDAGMLESGISTRERRGPAYVASRLSTPAIPVAAPPQEPLPDDVRVRLTPFLHRPIAARLRAGRPGLVDEHRKVSVAFVALPDWDHEEPQQAQEVVSAAVRVIDRYGGYLMQLDTGDKGNLLVVCFGAPLAHEDDEERAVRCCLELLAGHGVRVGLTTAFAFCGEIGSVRRREYLLMGDSVNLAARLMQAAGTGQLLVDERTHDRLAGFVVAEVRPPLRVKGKREPVVVHEVRGIVDQPIRLARTVGPLVGRHDELAWLEHLAGLAVAGRGRLVALTGEAGVGKSRLVAETMRIATRLGCTVHHGAADARETRTGYWAWRPVWQSLVGAGSRSLPAQRARVREYVALLDGGSAQRAPLLAPVLNIPMPDTELTSDLDAPTRAEFLHTLLADMLRERITAGPVVLVLDDCQWIDVPSAKLLVALTRELADLPVLLVITSRRRLAELPELAPLARLDHVTELALSELSTVDATQLVTTHLRQLYDDAPPSPALIDSLITRAAGNPFFLEELANLVHTRGLNPTNPGAAADLDLPDTLHGLLTARLDELDEAEQATLKVASVIGQTFSVSWVAGVYPALGGADAVRAHLDRLDRLDLTPLRSDGPDPEYGFRHGLTQEVTYRTLSFATRAELHEAVGEYIELTYPATVSSYIDALAYHYGHGTNKAKQLVWLRAAGDTARAAFANEVAIERYQRLLPLLPAEQRGEVLLHLGDLWHLTGQWTEAEQACREAIDAAETVDDRDVVAQSQRALGTLCTYRRAYSEAVAWLTKAGTEFTHLGDRRGVASTLDRLSFAYFQQGRYADALAEAERHLTIATAVGDQNGRSAALENMGLIHGHTSDHTKAIDMLTQALHVAEEADNQRAVSYAANDLAGVYLRKGDHIRAMTHLEQARQAAHRIGFRSLLAVCVGNAGELYREHGDHTRAMNCFNYALRIALDLGDLTSLLGQLGNLGLSAAAQGRTDIANKLLERAVILARTLTAPYLLCEFLYWLAKLRADHPNDAPGGYAAQLNAEALEIADRIDHRHHRLHCRLLAIRLTAGDTTAEQLRALLRQWTEPVEQAAIHTHLWRYAHDTHSRNKAATLILDLYQNSPSEDLREQLTTLTNTPPPPTTELPDLTPEVTHTNMNLDAILQQINLDLVDQLTTHTSPTRKLSETTHP